MCLLVTNAANPGQLNSLLLVGFLSAVLWLVCWRHQNTAKAFVIGLAISSTMLTAFALRQHDAWPLGFVTATLTISAIRRSLRKSKPRQDPNSSPSKATNWSDKSRVRRLFGSVGSEN